jgi:hypothetical protein
VKRRVKVKRVTPHKWIDREGTMTDNADDTTPATCNCGSDCRCGCQQGQSCKCGGKKD